MAKIGLDAGHYVGDGRVGAGWEAALGTGDEYTLNIRVFDAVWAKLEGAGHALVDIGRQDRSVTSRAKRAGSNGCDVVVSIHHNAGGGRGSTLYRHSNGVMGAQSKVLQEKIYAHVEKINKGNRSTPINQAELGVINCNNTKCPSVLVECAFMDNQTDVNLINSAGYADKMGGAIAQGIMDYVGAGSGSAPTNTMPAVSMTYPSGAYSRVTNLKDGDLLNVRSGPGVDYGVIRQLAQGNEVSTQELYVNGWAKVDIVGQIGYVNAYYLDINAGNNTETAKVVGCSALNVRKTPNGAVSATIHKGDTVQIIGSGKDSDGDTWTKIQCGKISGFVWPKYIE